VLAQQYLSSQDETFGILRRLLQHSLYPRRGIIEAIAENQELDIGSLNSKIIRIFCGKSAKFGGGLVELAAG
jgi:hypothetical protein